jgi:oxygen-independent coproporphyrinogen-3 oxidase
MNENILLLKQLSVSRIHIGVQTLSDPIRKLIGRREPRATVKNKLKKIVNEDFIVSVDILYGLPLQTLQEFVADIHELIETGLDGFALYELQISPGMRTLIKNNPAYHISKSLSYQMFIKAKTILNNTGYRTVFFNHFGNNRDKNLYFTYPSRGEDCLAFGTIADSRLETVFFRHMNYKKYLDAISKGGFGIDYGYREDDRRTLIRKFETCLMSGFIPESEINQMQQSFGYKFKGIFDLWRVAKLIVPGHKHGDFELTGSGCWLVSTMMEHTRDIENNWYNWL